MKEIIREETKDGFKEVTTREPDYPRKYISSPNYNNPAGRHELKHFSKWTREELIAHLMATSREATDKRKLLSAALARESTLSAQVRVLTKQLEELATLRTALNAEKVERQELARENIKLNDQLRERDAAIVALVLKLTEET